MKRKIRILSTVATMALVATVMCVGIYAATRVDITGSGSITFTATDVYANVTIVQSDVGTVYTKNFGKDQAPGAELSDTVTFETFVIDSATRQATVTITVKNNFETDTAIEATVTAAAEKDGATYDGVTIDVSGEDGVTIEDGVTTIAAADTETIIVTIGLTDAAVKNGVDEGVTFEFTLSLERAA